MHPSIIRGRRFWPLENHPELAVLETDDGSKTLICTGSGDTFHSVSGAFSETCHTYLHNSGIEKRLTLNLPSRVLEIGFGTGLGILVTAQKAIKTSTSLSFTSLETQWLDVDVIKQLTFEQWIDPELVESFLTAYCAFIKSQAGRFQWNPSPNIETVAIEVDTRIWLANEGLSTFDAIYFDPFAKETAPELWQSSVFHKLAGLLDAQGKLVTYSCARAVRDAIEKAGLVPTRVPGPPNGKRHSLIVTHPDNSKNDSD